MDVTAVFEGLAARADTITGLRGFPSMPDSISPPAFICVEVEIDYDGTFGRGMDDFTVTGRLLVPRSSDRAGQKKLQQYMKGSGAMSVKAAIEADKTLGGACDSLRVKSVRGMGQYEHQGVIYLGADFPVHVIGRGN